MVHGRKLGVAGTATRAGPATVPSGAPDVPEGIDPRGLTGDWKSQFAELGPAAIARDARSIAPSITGSRLASGPASRIRITEAFSLLKSITRNSDTPIVIVSKAGTF